MYNFALAQELYHFVHVGVVRKPQDIVICSAGFLLCREVLRKVGNGVALGLEICRRKGHSRRRSGINRVCVVYIIVADAVFVKALCALAVGKLPYYAADNLKMREFVSS